MVAPSRIERGLAEATAPEGSFLEQRPLSLLRYQHLVWLNTLRRQWDRLEYRWHRYVIGYDEKRQGDLLGNWLGVAAYLKSGLILVTGSVLVLSGYGLFGLWQVRQRRSRLDRLFLRFCRRIRRRGFERICGETAQQLAQRVATQSPHLAEPCQTFATLYTRLNFDPRQPPTREDYRNLTACLARL